MAGKSPLQVVIIGGSLSGLAHGIMLKHHGHNVRILEQSSASTRSSLAAGMSTGPDGARFFANHSRDLDSKLFAVPSPGLQHLDRQSKVVRTESSPLNLTTWTTLYYRLRALFDGLQSSCYPEIPTSDAKDGTAIFELGKRVVAVDYLDNVVTVHFEDIGSDRGTTSGTSEKLQADLVLDASGAFSSIRNKLLPELKQSYAGYVAWRGVVPEATVSDATKNLFGNWLNVSAMHRSYLVGYLIPGDDGNLTPGSRYINWLWYEPVEESSPRFKHVMTDSEGHTHRSTLPIGRMSPKVWEEQLERAQSVTPVFQELISLTRQPFISAIRECTPSQLSFFDGHLLLVGDAAGPLRPHVGQAFNQAATQCLLLEKLLNKEDDMSVESWERKSSESRAIMSTYSRLLGDWYMSGWIAISVSLLRFLSKLAWQRLGAWKDTLLGRISNSVGSSGTAKQISKHQ